MSPSVFNSANYSTLERIEFKLAVLVYTCLHQTAPPYLAEEFHQLSADEVARQRLGSVSTSSLVVRRTRLSTIGDRAFPVAAARLWNTLPLKVTSALSMSVSSVILSPNLLLCLSSECHFRTL